MDFFTVFDHAIISFICHEEKSQLTSGSLSHGGERNFLAFDIAEQLAGEFHFFQGALLTLL